MKLIVSHPPTGTCKSIDIDDEKKLRIFYEKRISHEVAGDALGEEFKGYVFKITGGNDKQGFPMMQGVLVQGRVRLLLKAGHSGYRPRREGERKRKSVRGCIVGPDLSALDLVIVKKGDAELPGITDKYVPRRLGPKRASKIRKLFNIFDMRKNLSKEDDVRKYANTYRKEVKPKTKDGKTIKRFKTVRIQRLVTPRRISNKRHEHNTRAAQVHKTRREAADYAKLLKLRNTEAKQRRESLVAKRRESSRRDSTRRDSTKKPATEEEKKGTKRAQPEKKSDKPAKPDAKGAKAPAKPAAKAAAKGAKSAAPAKPAAKAAASPAPAKPAAKEAAKKAPAAKVEAAKPAAKAAAKPAAKKQKQ